MLVSYKISNFKSFYQESELSLKSSRAKGNEESLIKTKFGNLLKVISVYGANSSGKSNLMESFKFLKFFATTPNIVDENFDRFLKYRKFVYDTKAVKSPIFIEVEFIVNDIMYLFKIGVSDSGIVEERLSFKKTNRSVYKYIYNVNLKKDIYDVNLELFNKDLQILFTAIKPSSKNSFLSTLSNMNYLGNEHIKNVYKWLDNIVGLVNIRDEIKISKLYEDVNDNELSDVLDRHRNFLNYCDIHIEKLSANKNELNEKLFVYTENKNEKGELISMPFDYESEGTKKILTLYSLLFEKLGDASLFVVDEMDSKLHPLLFEKLVETFKKKSVNKRGIQLIQSSHSLEFLINRDNYRLEEVVIVDKNDKGSHLSTLRDKDILANHSIIKNFYGGNYGGVPTVDTNKDF